VNAMRLRHHTLSALFTLALLLSGVVFAQESYQTPEAFVAEAFGGKPPPAKQLWLSDTAGEGYRAIMEEAPRRLRLHYWSEGTKDVWVLEAIGKEQPITAGFIVENGTLTLAKVLVFRESRGWEIRHPFFTRQFSGARLDNEQALDKTIDGISGATLSVRAMVRMSRLALFLSQHSRTSAS
jgi:hypothetical protein